MHMHTQNIIEKRFFLVAVKYFLAKQCMILVMNKIYFNFDTFMCV